MGCVVALANITKRGSSSHVQARHLRVRGALDGTYHLALNLYGYGTPESFHSHHDRGLGFIQTHN
jgi:hypothetical protein